MTLQQFLESAGREHEQLHLLTCYLMALKDLEYDPYTLYISPRFETEQDKLRGTAPGFYQKLVEFEKQKAIDFILNAEKIELYESREGEGYYICNGWAGPSRLAAILRAAKEDAKQKAKVEEAKEATRKFAEGLKVNHENQQ